MARPAPFFVGYEDSRLCAGQLAKHGGDEDAVDPADIWTEEDAATLRGARTLAKRRAREHNTTVTIYQRVNITQVTGPDEPVDLYDWDRKLLEDVTNGVCTVYALPVRITRR